MGKSDCLEFLKKIIIMSKIRVVLGSKSIFFNFPLNLFVRFFSNSTR